MIYERTEGGDFYAYQSKQAAGGGAGGDSGGRLAAGMPGTQGAARADRAICGVSGDPARPTAGAWRAYSLYIGDSNCSLDISGRTAYLSAWVEGYPGEATKCKVRAELQEKSGTYAWTTVDFWTDQQNGTWAEVDETATVTSGKTYRVKATVTVWAGSQSESQTFYSDEVEA